MIRPAMYQKLYPYLSLTFTQFSLTLYEVNNNKNTSKTKDQNNCFCTFYSKSIYEHTTSCCTGSAAYDIKLYVITEK